MGKGDSPRPVDKKKYDANYERIFGEQYYNQWKDAPGCEPETGPSDRSSDEVNEVPRGQDSSDDHESVEGEETL